MSTRRCRKPPLRLANEPAKVTYALLYFKADCTYRAFASSSPYWPEHVRNTDLTLLKKGHKLTLTPGWKATVIAASEKEEAFGQLTSQVEKGISKLSQRQDVSYSQIQLSSSSNSIVPVAGSHSMEHIEEGDEDDIAVDENYSPKDSEESDDDSEESNESDDSEESNNDMEGGDGDIEEGGNEVEADRRPVESQPAEDSSKGLELEFRLMNKNLSRIRL